MFPARCAKLTNATMRCTFHYIRMIEVSKARNSCFSLKDIGRTATEGYLPIVSTTIDGDTKHLVSRYTTPERQILHPICLLLFSLWAAFTWACEASGLRTPIAGFLRGVAWRPHRSSPRQWESTPLSLGVLRWRMLDGSL